MTTIDIQTVNGTTIINIAGHANYSKDHNDIVCASVSTLSQSFLESLKFYQKKEECIILDVDIDEKLGVLSVKYKSCNDEIINALLIMLITGLSMLQNAYPENIFLNIE